MEVTVEMNENQKKDADSIDKEKEVTSEINFVAIKEEPYNEEENYVDENAYEEEFPFMSCGIKQEGPAEGGAEEAAKDQEKTCSEERIKTEEPETQEQQQLSDYEPLNPLCLCEVTFGHGNANSRLCGQAEVTAQTNRASTTADTIIKEEVCTENAEDKQPKTEKTCSEENMKTEEPETQEQQQLSDYDPLNPLYLCEVTFGHGNANSRLCGQAEVTARTNQASCTAATIIKEEVSIEDAEDKQPKTEKEYCTRAQMKQKTRDSQITNSFKHNKNLIIPDVLTSCIQCGSAECQCLQIKRKRRSRKTVKMKFECDICQKVLASRKTLKQHKLTHSGVRNYFCPVCNKTFVQLRQLSDHKLIHTGIKKYQCETCNKAFTQRRTLAQHRLIHSDIKRYQCDICSKAFLQRSSLAQHKFVHSGVRKHKCDVCDKAFSQQRKLAEHKLIHSGIKKYQCDICLKAFTQQRTMSQHRLIHSNIKNHKCDICDKAFTRRDTLLRHRAIHSNINTKIYKKTLKIDAFV